MLLLLSELVEGDPSLSLVGTAVDADAAIELASRTRPHVALIDVKMPGGGGPRATSEIARCSPTTQVVALSGDGDRDAVLNMVSRGVAGYVLKNTPLSEIAAAIRRVAGGHPTFSPRAARSVVDELASKLQQEEQQALSRRQRVEGVRALLDSPFQVALQPIIDLHEQKPVGFEALARFAPEFEGGPAVWFAEAEAAGLLAELEIKALRRALEQLPNLPSTAYLAVNLSPDVLLIRDFAELVAMIPPSRLVLEITEHAPIADYEKLEEVLAGMRAEGLRLAVDDAGAGFASLRHILRLGPNLIKLDISLTRNIHESRSQRALTSALKAFADETDAVIVAEGVENESELGTLRRLGVRYAQGYHLGRPVIAPHIPLVAVAERGAGASAEAVLFGASTA